MRLQLRKKICFLCVALLLCLNIVIVSADEEKVVFQKGDLIQLGSYNDEPIQWYVLHNDQDNLVVVSRNVLSIKPFDAAGDVKEKDEYYSYAFYYGSNNWAESTLRKWLNSSDKNIDWNGNAPNENQIFGGENAHDQEAGFLHKTNFSTGERKAIVPTSHKSADDETLNDLVVLMSSAEYHALYMNSDIYPIQLPTLSAISKSDYHSSSLKPGQQYPIWTRDVVDNPYASHAVKVMSESGEESVAPASSGRYGVMPMMTLDHQLLKEHLIQGEGTGGSPYIFNISTSFSLPMIGVVGFLVLSLGGVLLLKYKRTIFIKNSGVAVLVISILLMPYILAFGVSEVPQDSNYVIVRSYALQKELVFERMDLMLESNSLFIIDEKGNDVTETIDRDQLVNMTMDQKEDFLKYLDDEKYYLLNGGDFRVANFANEIDGVYNGDHYIVSLENAEMSYQKAIDKNLNETFMTDNHGHYLSRDYEAIMAYLIKNDLTVRHPSDTSGIGIPSLHWGY